MSKSSPGIGLVGGESPSSRRCHSRLLPGVIAKTRLVPPTPELRLAHADGTYPRLLARLARVDVLVIDDWGLSPLKDEERRDLLEIMEDRYGLKSTIWTSQLPVEIWHDHMGDPTIADAICDRVIHNAHRIVLKGPSKRKNEAKGD
jgi:DNA replication protein DnaC